MPHQQQAVAATMAACRRLAVPCTPPQRAALITAQGPTSNHHSLTLAEVPQLQVAGHDVGGGGHGRRGSYKHARVWGAARAVLRSTPTALAVPGATPRLPPWLLPPSTASSHSSSNTPLTPLTHL